MKKKLSTFAILMLFAGIVSCSPDSNLSEALELAGDNRAELEKVLAHYAGEP